MTLGENLQRLRKEKGLSQEEVAQALFVSRQSVSKWETDKAEPGIKALKGLGRLYGVTLDELAGTVEEYGPDGGTCQEGREFLQMTLIVRILALLIGMFFVDEGLLLHAWDLPFLFAGERFPNRFIWGGAVTLGGASLLVQLIATVKTFWRWYDYGVGMSYGLLFATTGMALALSLLLHRKTRYYFHSGSLKLR